MKIRKFAALMLALVIMALSFAASAEVAGEEKLKTYDPQITLTFAKPEVVTSYAPGEDAQENSAYKYLWEELMGIRVENKILAPSASMTEKMQLAIAGDDIPDFAIVDTIMMASLMKNEMVADLTDVYETWATDNLKTLVGQNDNGLFAPVTGTDGRIYGIPVPNTLGDSYPILYIRQDWLDALGLEAPKTMDEALDIAMKFATEDPDGNGEADTYGLYMDKDLFGLDFITDAYGAYTRDEFWVRTEDGSFIAGPTDPKAKKPLEKLAELYAAGAIDPEFAIKDASKAEELIAAGKVGMYVGLFFHPLGAMKNCVANVEGSDWTPVAMPPAEGVDAYKPGVPLNVYGYIYAKEGIEHPEAIIVMMNWLCDGYALPVEGNAFYDKYNELATTPEISQTSGVNNLMPFQMAANINWGETFNEAVANGWEHVEGKDADYQRVISTELPPEDSWAWKKVYLEAYLAINFDNVRYSDYAGAPTETAVKVQSLLDTQKQKDYIAIIMGDQSIDYFDTFVETYNSIGASQIAEEIKAALGE